MFFLISTTNCTNTNIYNTKEYKTKCVIVVVMDGARYSETFGDSTHSNIHFLSDTLSKFGVINTEFYNNGFTLTIPGHTQIMTGIRQLIDNSGVKKPEYPSFMQCWSSSYDTTANNTWIITSKDKLEVLNNCNLSDWKNKYLPKTNCGINGNGTGYRNDKTTFDTLISIMSIKHPKLIIVNFCQPDNSGHSGNWNNYLKGIKLVDSLTFEIFKFVMKDTFYSGKTTIFYTNDHGRHLDTVKDGFVSHGCSCLGCRHLMFFAYGPDFISNVQLKKERNLSDISKTIAELLHFDMQYSDGRVMTELFK